MDKRNSKRIKVQKIHKRIKKRLLEKAKKSEEKDSYDENDPLLKEVDKSCKISEIIKRKKAMHEK